LGAFGEKLRKQRELRGIELDAISNTTKISTRMLRALEDEHFDQLPGGVFNKGFVRAYARQVGLDEEETIADYLAALRDNQIQAHSTSPDFRDPGTHLLGNDLPGTDVRGKDLPGKDLPHGDSSGNNTGPDRSRQLLTADRRKRGRRNESRREEDRRNVDGRYKDLSFLPSSSTSASAAHPPAERFRQKYPAGGPERPPSDHELSIQIPWGKLAVALLVVTFALALWNSRRHREPTAAAPQFAAASNRSPAPAPFTAPAPPTQSGSAASLPVDKASPAPTSPAGKLSGATIPGSTIPGATISAASQTESTNGSATTSPANSPSPNPTVERAAASAPATPPRKLSLLIRAEETAWVSIVADGKPVAQETLIAPAQTSVRASGEVLVKTGNAAGLSFQLNGKEIPAQGDEGEVKTYVFDAAGFRVLPQPQAAPDR
jgi:hypothetical protein